MAHTCKPGADDEMFAVNQPEPGKLSMPAYGRRMEADHGAAAAQLHLRECSDSALQRFVYDSGESLVLFGTELCLAVAPEAGRPTGEPSDLFLPHCSETESALTRWLFPGRSTERTTAKGLP